MKMEKGILISVLFLGINIICSGRCSRVNEGFINGKPISHGPRQANLCLRAFRHDKF